MGAVQKTHRLYKCVMCGTSPNMHDAVGGVAYFSISCAICDSVTYCSSDCRKEDIYVHETLCSAYAKHKATERPSDEHFRAFIFPAQNLWPRVIWLHCPKTEDGQGPSAEFIRSTPGEEVEVTPVIHSYRTGELLHVRIKVASKAEWWEEEEKNMSVTMMRCAVTMNPMSPLLPMAFRLSPVEARA
jgi:hypothetical protein